jgi:glycosyltransferase involved in cell wall biosynthesis
VGTRRDSGRADLKSGAPELSVVVPVYNEGENVTATLRGLHQALDGVPNEILVVYDFDEDDTVPVVKRLQAELPTVRPHRNQIGRGVLNAMKAGFEAARAPFVLVTMADGSDDPREIPAMLELARGGADLVAGSRYMRGGRQVGGPLLKRTMSRAAGLSLHWVGGVPIHDPTSNYKLYSRRLLERVTIESSAGFELAIELTVKAHLLGMRVAEVPTTWRDRTAGQSRFQLRKWLPHYLHWYGAGMRGRFRRR